MRLHQAIESYLSLKCSLGAVFLVDSRILQSFGRSAGDTQVKEISPEVCQSFCRGTGPPTRWWERKHQSLCGFFRYLVSRGMIEASPLPESGPHIPRSFEAYIYTHSELQRLLDATQILKTTRFQLEPLTVRTLLLVLYGAGLRASEGLNLRCCDVDLDDQVLTIWDSKFFTPS